jgi:hypothetical protein
MVLIVNCEETIAPSLGFEWVGLTFGLGSCVVGCLMTPGKGGWNIVVPGLEWELGGGQYTYMGDIVLS